MNKTNKTNAKVVANLEAAYRKYQEIKATLAAKWVTELEYMEANGASAILLLSACQSMAKGDW